jgi:pimeloyl-ACP methyl ester carboxylesterase
MGAGSRTVLVLHGGHVSAAVPLGERDLLDLGLRILAVCRPGYGRTPATTAGTRTAFGDVVARLCRYLEADRLAAVVEMSHGGPSAVALAAGHPELVKRLILEAAVSSLPWPGRATRVGAHLAFNYPTAPLTWRLIGVLARWAPGVFLRTMLRALSTGSGARGLADLSLADRVEVLALLRSMQASHEFLHDLPRARRPRPGGAGSMPDVDHCQPGGRSSPAPPRRAPAPPHPRRNPHMESRPQPPDLVWIVGPRTERTGRAIPRRGSAHASLAQALESTTGRQRRRAFRSGSQRWSPVPRADRQPGGGARLRRRSDRSRSRPGRSAGRATRCCGRPSTRRRIRAAHRTAPSAPRSRGESINALSRSSADRGLRRLAR